MDRHTANVWASAVFTGLMNMLNEKRCRTLNELKQDSEIPTYSIASTTNLHGFDDHGAVVLQRIFTANYQTNRHHWSLLGLSR